MFPVILFAIAGGFIGGGPGALIGAVLAVVFLIAQEI